MTAPKPKRPVKPAPPAPQSAPPPAAPAAADLFPIPTGGPAAFHLGPIATAEQLFPITGRTDAQLRALAAQPQAWFPKPIRGKYDTLRTLAGLRASETHRAEQEKAASLPAVFASMQDCEARLRYPVEMQQFARRNGCTAFEASNRVHRAPLSEYFFPILKKIFGATGITLKGIEGLEQLDADLELARLRKQQREDLEDQAAIRRRQMILLPDVEEILWEKGLGPLRAAILNYRKITAPQLKTMLQSHGLKPAEADRVIELAVTAVENLLKQIRDLLPQCPGEGEGKNKAA